MAPNCSPRVCAHYRHTSKGHHRSGLPLASPDPADGAAGFRSTRHNRHKMLRKENIPVSKQHKAHSRKQFLARGRRTREQQLTSGPAAPTPL